MIQYKCDMCRKENIERKDINIFTMPRVLRSYIIDAIGVKLQSFDKFDEAETHLCETCCIKLASMLEVVEPNE